jgi:hypothetical protein
VLWPCGSDAHRAEVWRGVQSPSAVAVVHASGAIALSDVGSTVVVSVSTLSDVVSTVVVSVSTLTGVVSTVVVSVAVVVEMCSGCGGTFA